MYKIPITVCLYTSAKGHFDRKDIYQKTVNSLLSQIPANSFEKLVAHIKVKKDDPAEDEQAIKMVDWLEEKGFTVLVSYGDWKHGNESHQLEFLKDMMTVTKIVKTPYILFLEDDWEIKPFEKDLEYWIHSATELLEEYTSLVQVRIPRYTNEVERINKLKQKHGINTSAIELVGETDVFISGDWSNNPHISRTRDFRGALTLLMNSNLPRHSEHGLGTCMKIISWNVINLPFAFFNPEKIRAGHLGTPIGQEDNLDKPLIES